ncbi:hypothetical protein METBISCDRAFT_26481 [Metschnikowia bicuspidata]|uniref:Uncharacterized protein n=1 Tax=Metschnikowia bicuspidata TaxID=27322 RepID=A0A4P9ZEZ7_9ASCO|nr:hypothetical protein METBISCDRAFT_26481 [Metschnikowia bicuspidata]
MATSYPYTSDRNWFSRSVSSFFEAQKKNGSSPDLWHQPLAGAAGASNWLKPADTALFDSWLGSPRSYGASSRPNGPRRARSLSDRRVRRPATANVCSQPSTTTYAQMAAARIGVQSAGPATYHTVEGAKTRATRHDSAGAAAGDGAWRQSADASPLRSSRGGLLMDLSLKGRAPQRCFLIEDEEWTAGTHREKARALHNDAEYVRSYVRSVADVARLRPQFSLLQLFHPTGFWSNYRHLEMEVMLFHDDYDFIRQTVADTCGAVAHKVVATHRFLVKAQYCHAEYQHLRETLRHIESTAEQIGTAHHESHMLNVQRSLRVFEDEFQQLLRQTRQLDGMRCVADQNLYGLAQCMHVNALHRTQHSSLLRKFDLFHQRYRGYTALMRQFFRPLYRHFGELKDAFAGDTFCVSALEQFHRALSAAAADNCRAHDAMNQMLGARREMPQILRRVQETVRRKQSVCVMHLVVDGALEESRSRLSWRDRDSRSGSPCKGNRRGSPRRGGDLRGGESPPAGDTPKRASPDLSPRAETPLDVGSVGEQCM